MIPAALAALLAACGGSAVDGPSSRLLASTGAAEAAQPLAADYYDVVQRIYLAYFGRHADPAGLQYWAHQRGAEQCRNRYLGHVDAGVSASACRQGGYLL